MRKLGYLLLQLNRKGGHEGGGQDQELHLRYQELV